MRRVPQAFDAIEDSGEHGARQRCFGLIQDGIAGMALQPGAGLHQPSALYTLPDRSEHGSRSPNWLNTKSGCSHNDQIITPQQSLTAPAIGISGVNLRWKVNVVNQILWVGDSFLLLKENLQNQGTPHIVFQAPH